MTGVPTGGTVLLENGEKVRRTLRLTGTRRLTLSLLSPLGENGKMHWPVEWGDPPESDEISDEVNSETLTQAQEAFRRLTPEERLLFLEWVQQGTPDED